MGSAEHLNIRRGEGIINQPSDKFLAVFYRFDILFKHEEAIIIWADHWLMASENQDL